MTQEEIVERLRDGKPSLTPRELAQALNCSRSYVYKIIKAKAITFGRLGSDYRIPVEEARKLALTAGIPAEP